MVKVLIVNGYKDSQNRNYLDFKNNVYKLIMNQKVLLDTELEFFYRDYQNINDLVLDFTAQNANQKAALLFDSLDIVFLQIDSCFKPWQYKSQNFLSLIRMCLHTQKTFFASGEAFNFITYICATDFSSKVNIINGLNGSNINQLQKIEQCYSNFEKNDYFLDNVTGDLYSYVSSTREWQPKTNIGQHLKQALNGSSSMSQFIINKQNLLGQQLDLQNLYTSKNTEQICEINKDQTKSWVFDRVRGPFLCEVKSVFAMHPFNFVNPQRTFKIIAQSKQMIPLILKMDYLLSTQFEIQSKHKDTLQILENFINHSLLDYEHLNKKNSVLKADLKRNVIMENPQQEDAKKKLDAKQLLITTDKFKDQVDKSALRIRLTSAKSIQHSGYLVKKQQGIIEITDNNAIAHAAIDSIKSTINKEIQEYSLDLRDDLKFFLNEQDSIKKTDLFQKRSIPSTQGCYNMSRPTTAINKAPSRPQTGFAQTESNPNLIRIESAKTNFTKYSKLTNNTKYIQSDDESKNKFQKTQSEIRQMLHPNTKKENLPKKQKQWVPGYWSSIQRQISNDPNNDEHQIQRVQSINCLHHKKRNNSIQKSIQSIEKDRSQPMIQNSGPYMSVYDIIKNDDKISKKKQIGPAFKPLVKNDQKEIQNYVFQDKSEPPLLYQFRRINTAKWLGPPFKLQ